MASFLMQTKKFDELSTIELYDILQLREEVFVLEQNCLYKDIDNKDKESFHVMCYKQNRLIAYARLLPKGLSYNTYCSIGRVVSNKLYRNTGIGILLMKEVMKQMKNLFPDDTIKISAQYYLIKFYEKFGFKTIGESYLEDDIPHIAMLFIYGK